MPTVHMKKVYDKASHFRKGNYAPVISKGVYSKDSLNVTVHMTPELRSHPVERRALLRHEKEEANILARKRQIGKVKQTDYSHRHAASHDPEWLNGEKGYTNVWERLGHKNPKFE